MKRLLAYIGIAALVFILIAQSYQTKVYKDSNGDREVVASGGILDLRSGHKLVINGDTCTVTVGKYLASSGKVFVYVPKTDSSDFAIASINTWTGGDSLYMHRVTCITDTVLVKLSVLFTDSIRLAVISFRD